MYILCPFTGLLIYIFYSVSHSVQGRYDQERKELEIKQIRSNEEPK